MRPGRRSRVRRLSAPSSGARVLTLRAPSDHRPLVLAASLIARMPQRWQSFGLRLSRRLRLHRGALPDFIVIGTQKGGTTALYAHLRDHPQVLPCAAKEVHFFDLQFARGEGWYRRCFLAPDELPRSLRPQGADLIDGEASPYYLFHPHVGERIARTTPGAKLIVLLRDPVDRAYSHFQHNVRKGRETLSFADALKREAAVLPAEQALMEADPDRISQIHQHYSYAARGRYAEQLERYFRHFAREQMLILKSEDFFARPAEVYSEVLQFLGIGERRLEAARVPNAGGYAREQSADRQALRNEFSTDNRRLYALIGRDFGW
jgi:hypothetical protein